MRVQLIFDGFEEREALQAQHAIDYIVALNDIENEIRKRWKWGEYATEEARHLMDDIHKYVSEVLAGLPEYE